MKKVHHHVAHRPHRHLMQHVGWYNKWHNWDYHRHIHAVFAGAYVFLVLLLVVSSYTTTYAWDVSTTWDFADSGDFAFDDDTVETSGTSARLKAQNYSTDGDTAGLFHFDESGGATASDSSANANDAAVQDDGTFSAGNLNNALTLDGNSDYASVPDDNSLNLDGQHSIEAWTKFSSTFNTNASQDQGIVDKGSYKFYYDRTSGKMNYEIADTGSASWTRQAGVDTNNSWDLDGKNIIRTIASSGSDIYAGLGLGTGDAEVWHWDGSTWEQIGGDGKNSGWADQVFEDVHALEVSGTTLYAGLGTNAAGDAEVWSCDLSSDCSDWTKIGGDAVNSSWAINTFEAVLSLTVVGSDVYAGLGASANDAEVWQWNGSTWTKIGGDSVNSGWTTNYEAVRALENDGTNVYAGIGDTAADAEVWQWNGSSWTKIGGDSTNSSWATADNIEYALSLDFLGGNLYAGTGSTAGDADVWAYSGGTWTKIGGDAVNSSWAASTYEIVSALNNDGSTLYAGVGNSNGDGEVYTWNGSAWTKIGGDSTNSSWATARGDGVYAFEYVGGTMYTGIYDSAGDGNLWSWNGSAWTVLGGGYINRSWGFYNLQSVESSSTYNSKLYVGTGLTVAGNAMVWEFDGSSWTLVGGQGLNNSWAADSFENVYTLQVYNGELYAGLGTTANDAEVWKYDGNTWTQVGGDSLNSGWTTNFEAVQVLTVYDGELYAGLGNSANDGEVWRWNGSTWTKIGGDSLNSGWTTNIDAVLSMTVYDGSLYVGTGASAGESDVWRWNGSSWTHVGGDGVASSWPAATNEEVFIMRVYNGKLVVGLGNSTDDAEVWEYDGSTWTKIGGDDVNNSWTAGTYERVRAMAIYNGELYAGIGDTAGDGELWKYNGSTWTQLGGDSLNSGWTNVIEYVSTLQDYKGKLYAGTGFSANVDAGLWSMGNNAFLSSTQSSQDTNWHHVAATYNGSTMKIYVDGVEDASTSASVTVPNNSLPLLVGGTYGSGSRGENQGFFTGQLDELRLSDTARSSFTTDPYPTSKETIELDTAAFTSGIQDYETFTVDETLNGGTITYRLSNDDGDTWQYWDGDSWEESGSLDEANSSADVNTNIASFAPTFDGIKWQAVFDSNGDQQVQLNSVTITANSDAVSPSANASNLAMFKTNGGASVASNDWTNGGSPYFTWDAGADVGSGILGYCLYLGQDDTANPVTTKGLLGTSPVETGDHCQFVVSSNSIDLATAGMLGSALTTSSSPYYLSIRAIDNAGNVIGSNAQFQFRFDNTAPSNPGYVTAPSGFINTKEATLTWPTAGGAAPADAASGVIGLQYKIGATTWYGDDHTGSGDITDLLDNDGSYTTIDPTDFDNIEEGTNTIYFRTWDAAGNVTSSYVTAALKVNTNGAPSEPQNLTVDPDTNTSNAFSFDWDSPSSFVGDEENLNYCYTVNAQPSVSNCVYTGAGVTSLAEGAFATQPGVNTLYVVARDESNSINYDSYSTVDFTANTPSPGMPTNTDIVDVSVKSTSNWRLAITWDEPDDEGAGISSYKVYRSTDDDTYTFRGSSASTTYIDAGLSQQTYYYKVKACDSTNNCSAYGTAVDMLPTGKFTEAASITSAPKTSDITTTKATISWSTDRDSDSKVAIGTKSGQYGASEIGSSNQVTSHEIELDNLAAGTTYYYKVKWTDEDGNTGTSQEYSFKTSPAPVMKEVSTASIGLSSATVKFTTVGAHKVNLYYGKSESFGGLKSTNTSTQETDYAMEMTGLDDGTKYFYQLSTFDSEGREYKGNIFSFTTPPRPRITNLRFEPVKGEPTSTQKITWDTNVASTSQVSYGKVGTSGTEVQNSKMVKSHSIVIKGLEDASKYFLVAQSRDADGNLATSDEQTFTTALDTRPPEVYEVTVESSIRGTGAEARGQVIVSWKTDEPSTSQVGYAEGSNAQTFNNKSTEDTQLTTEHIVVVSDLPTSKVYSIQPMSYDKARNVGLGAPESAIIGRASESVLTIILNTLQRVFGL